MTSVSGVTSLGTPQTGGLENGAVLTKSGCVIVKKRLVK